jgi:hypothetical protein
MANEFKDMVVALNDVFDSSETSLVQLRAGDDSILSLSAANSAINKYFFYKEKLNAIRNNNLLKIITDDKNEAVVSTERNISMINNYLKAYDPTYVPRTA